MRASRPPLPSLIWIGGSLISSILLIMWLDRLNSTKEPPRPASPPPAAPASSDRGGAIERQWASLAPAPAPERLEPLRADAWRPAGSPPRPTDPSAAPRSPRGFSPTSPQSLPRTAASSGPRLAPARSTASPSTPPLASAHGGAVVLRDADPPFAARDLRWASRTLAGAGLTNWPASPQLQQDLLAVQDPAALFWRDAALETLTELEDAGTIHSAASANTLERLRALHQDAVLLIRTMPLSAARDEVWRAAYSLQRRLDVWTAARDSLGRPELESAARDAARQALQAVAERLEQEPQAASWREFLLCDEIAALLHEDPQGRHHELAGAAVRRLVAARRDHRFRPWLQDDAFTRWETALRAWAVLPIDSVQLVHDLETFEAAASPHGRRRMADLLDALQLTEAGGEVTRQLNSHYRNANLRVAVAQQLLDRFSPEETVRREPVAETILGAPVRGNSQVAARTRLYLTPSPEAWLIGLAASGQVEASTWSSRGPAVVYNDSHSSFAVDQQLRLDRQGMHVGYGAARANTQSRLNDLETTLDGIPLLGWLTRQIALNQYEKLQEDARREAEFKLANKLQDTFDQEIARAGEAARQKYQQRVAAPLERFRLQPEILQLETTTEQLIGRFRLVGQGQLGAHTPRPASEAGDLVSVQIHETLINNVLNGMDLNGRRFELTELLSQLARDWGFENWAPPEELPADVYVQFAPEDAITVDLDEQRIRLRLDLDRLENGQGSGFDHFQVMVDFEPVAEDRRLVLARTGIIRVAGDRIGFRDRLPLRGIFAKVFNKSRTLNLTGEALQEESRLSGAELHVGAIVDGWATLGLRQSPHLAGRPDADAPNGVRASLR